MNKNQQYVTHALITLGLTILSAVAVATWQFATSHPFDMRTILAVAVGAFGVSLAHGLATLSITPAQALQALWDWVNQLSASHQQVVATVNQIAATQNAHLDMHNSTPVVQVQSGAASQPGETTVVVSQAPQPTSQSVTPLAPIAPLVAPDTTLSMPVDTAMLVTQPVGVVLRPDTSEQFTAPIGIVTKQ